LSVNLFTAIPAAARAARAAPPDTLRAPGNPARCLFAITYIVSLVISQIVSLVVSLIRMGAAEDEVWAPGALRRATTRRSGSRVTRGVAGVGRPGE
jgi:hypothetical protein